MQFYRCSMLSFKANFLVKRPSVMCKKKDIKEKIYISFILNAMCSMEENNINREKTPTTG